MLIAPEDPRCPECGGTEIIVKQDEMHRITRRVRAYRSAGGFALDLDGEEIDSDVLDTEDPVVQCEDCGFESEDDADFDPANQEDAE